MSIGNLNIVANDKGIETMAVMYREKAARKLDRTQVGRAESHA